MNFYFFIKTLLIFFIFISCSEEKSGRYEQDKAVADSLRSYEQYEEAILKLEEMRSVYEAHHYDITKELALLYSKVGRHEESFKLWRGGHQKGYFYGLFKHFSIYKPFREFAEFDSISKEDMRIRANAISKSKTTYKLKFPENYNSEKFYPLMIVLHGGGSSIQNEQKYWTSNTINKDFIVAFIQSYLYYDMTTFGWLINDDRAREDLLGCFSEIINRFRIDTAKVIIGGISAGGYTAMDIAINNIFQTTGFIAVCPDVTPEDFKHENITIAAGMGLRGIIISGENDYLLANQKKVIKMLNENNYSHHFKIIGGIGHEYPPNFPFELNSAINYILTNR